MQYNLRLSKESAGFFVGSFKLNLKFAGTARRYQQPGESSSILPPLSMNGTRYFAIRYGPHPLSVDREHYTPTSYVILTDSGQPVDDKELATEVARLYRIWEEVYLRPYKKPRAASIIDLSTRFENEIYTQIVERQQKSSYDSSLESKALQELDKQVTGFHSARLKLLDLEKQLGAILFDIFEHPSDEIIGEFMRITSRFQELISTERAMLDERIDTWQRFREITERKYEVKIEMDFDWVHLALGAFVDAMKYSLTKDPIPEGLLTAFSADAVRDVVKAKGTEAFLNLIMHYGGIGALKRHLADNDEMTKSLEKYVKIWKSGIPEEMIRFPSPA